MSSRWTTSASGTRAAPALRQSLLVRAATGDGEQTAGFVDDDEVASSIVTMSMDLPCGSAWSRQAPLPH